MIKWKNEYSVNIRDIDEQHKKLFEIISKIYDLSTMDDKYDHYDEILSILDELKDYTIYHFDFEEKLLDKYNYDESGNQKIEHSFFVKKLERIGRKDIDGEQTETVLEISKFVLDWIASHILKNDMKYKQFLNDKGVY